MTIFEDKTELWPIAAWKKMTGRSKSAEARAEELIKFSVTCLRDEPLPPQAIQKTLARLDLLGAPKHYHRYNWRESFQRFRFISISVCSVMILSGSIWMWHIDQTPTWVVPGHVLPADNAYDDFKAAGASIVNSKQINQALTQLREAEQTVQPPSTFSEEYSKLYAMPAWNAVEKGGYANEGMKQLVTENMPTINRFRNAISKPYLEPAVRSVNTLLPHLAHYRGIARLLLLDSKLKAQEGEWNRSTQDCLDILQLGVEIPHGGTLLHKLVGIGIESTGRDQMWKVIDHLNAVETRAALSRMQDITARRVKLSEVFQEEKYYNEAVLLEIFQKPYWRFENHVEAPLPDYNPVLANIAKSMHFLQEGGYRYTKSQIISQLDERMDGKIKSIDQPLAFNDVNWSPTADDTSNLDPIVQKLLPVFNGLSFQEVCDSQVQNVLIETTLAIHAYHLEHGSYPKALSDLLNGYLSELPMDPFAPRDTLKYALNMNSYKLYSVGPDCKDDLGSAIISSSNNSDMRSSSNPDQKYGILPTSHGDIVAGVNTRASSGKNE